MKILFLHGLDSLPYQDRIDILSVYGNVDMPKIDYRKESNIFNDLLDKVKQNQYDIIIGHSLGGLLAFHLCNTTLTKCLMFMPAFSSDYKKLLSFPEYVNNQPIYTDMLAIISVRDQVVNNQLTKDTLPIDDIVEVDDVQGDNGHSLSPKLLETWFKTFMGLNESFLTSFQQFKINERHNDVISKVKNTSVGTILPESDIYQYVEFLHHGDDPFSDMENDGNLSQRIECYNHFKLQMINVSDINVNQFMTDDDKIDEYCELYQKTKKYPPIVLGHQFLIDDDFNIEMDDLGKPIIIGDDYEIIDGSHRIQALIKCGLTSVKAWVGVLADI